ncbi:MAG: hypothetical protein V9E94_04710, partial [Microthrixaceae bacterium]
TAAQREAAAKVDEILAAARNLPMQASYRFEGDGLKFLVVPTRGARGGPGGPGGKGGPSGSMAQIEETRAKISAVADDYGRAVADLLNERESIRQEIGQALQLTKSDSIDRALYASMRVATRQENVRSFSDYRTAVFEPDSHQNSAGCSSTASCSSSRCPCRAVNRRPAGARIRGRAALEVTRTGK